MHDEADPLAPLTAGRVVSEEWETVYLMIRPDFFISLLLD